jgi:hypothetical protein
MPVPKNFVIKTVTVTTCVLTTSVSNLVIISEMLLNAKEYTCKGTHMFLA